MAHFKGLHLQKLLEQKAKETTQFRDKAEENIAAAEKLIQTGKKVEADISKAEELLNEAKSALSNKDYQGAAEYAERAMEETKRAHYSRISNIISSAENMVVLTQKIGADVMRATEYLTRAKTALEHDEYDRALDFANQSWKENEKILREHLSKAFSHAQSLIVFGKNLGQETSTAEDSLRSARDAMDSGNYELALSLTNQCVDAIGVGVSDGVSKIIEEIKGYVKHIESDEEISKIETLLATIQKDLEKYDYERAMNGAKRAKLEAENSLKKSIGNRITSLEKNIETADKTGSAKLKELLNNAKTALKSGDFNKSLEYLSTIKSEADEVQTQKVLNVIAQSRNSFIYAKKIGVDISGVLAMLEKARDLMKDGKYDEAMKYAEKSKTDAENIVEEFQSTAGEIKYIQDSLASAEQIGVDLSSLKSSVENAKAALAAKDFKKAKEYAKRCKDTIDQTLYMKVLEIVKSAEQMSTIAEKTDATTPESNAMLEEAVSAMKTKDYKKAVDFSNKYKSEMKDHIRTKLENLIKTTDSDFEKVGKNASMDLTDAREILDDAKKSLKSTDYETTYTQITESRKEIDDVQWKETKKIYDYVRENCDSIKKFGGDVSIPEKSLADAQAAVENKQFPKAAEILDRVLDELRVVEQKFAEETFFAAKLAVIEVKKTGGDINILRDILKVAKTAMESGDYKEAWKNSAKAKQQAEKQKTVYEETFEAMSSAAALIAEAKKFNVDATKAIERLLAARTAFEKSDYAKAMEFAYECRDEAKRIMSRFTSAKKIINVTEKIATAEKLNFDTRGPKETLDRATTAIKTSDYVSAMDLATLAENEIGETLEGNINFNITSTESLIEQAKAQGIDIADAEKYINDAKDALNSKAYEDAVSFVNIARESLVKTAEQSQKVHNDIKRVEIRFTEAETLHIDVSGARQIYNHATECYKERSYAQAESYALKALGEIEKSQKQFINSMISDVNNGMEKAKTKKINVSVVQNSLDFARTAVDKSDFHGALDIIMRSKTELESIMDQYESVVKAVNEAAVKIADAEKAGVNTEKARDILKSVNNLIKDGKFLEAVKVANEVGSLAIQSSTQTQGIEELIKKAETQIRTVSQIGLDLDFKNASELVAKAKRSLVNWDYDNAQKYSDESLKLIKTTIDSYLNNSLSRLESMVHRCENEELDVSEIRNTLHAVHAQTDKTEYEMALKGVENANYELNKLMNTASPKTEVKFETKTESIVGEWTDAEIILTNTGRSSARNIRVAISGNAEITGLHSLDELRTGATERIPIKMRPTAIGSQSYTIKIDLERAFDGKSRTLEEVKVISIMMPPPQIQAPPPQAPIPPPPTPAPKPEYQPPVPPPVQSPVQQPVTPPPEAPPPAKSSILPPPASPAIKEVPTMTQPVGPETPTRPGAPQPISSAAPGVVLKCEICYGKIKPGIPIIVCQCGKTYHQMCGTRAGKCKNCGRELPNKETATPAQ